MRIFLSHNVDRDGDAASRMKAALETAGEGFLRVFLSSSMPIGGDWQTKVKRALSECDGMLLLYTDPLENWDWCMWEAGYFMSTTDASPDKFFSCIYPPGVQPPPPLMLRQNSRADDAGLSMLLETLFLKPYSLNPSLFSREKSAVLESTKRTIADAVGSRPEHAEYPIGLQVELDAKAMKALTPRQLPRATRFFSSDQRALKVLGLSEAGTRYSWSKVRAQLSHPEIGIPGLAQALSSARDGCGSQRILPLFQPRTGGPCYRPMLGRKTVLRDGGARFNLIVAEIPPTFDPNDKSHKSMLLHLLASCRILDWLVTTENMRSFQSAARQDQSQIERWVDDVADDLEHWFADANARGFDNFDDITQTLVFAHFWETDRIVRRTLRPTYNRLRKAIATRKPRPILECLQKLQQIGRFVESRVILELAAPIPRDKDD